MGKCYPTICAKSKFLSHISFPFFICLSQVDSLLLVCNEVSDLLEDLKVHLIAYFLSFNVVSSPTKTT